ncbi:MAG: SDR family NAD(P)-dependent oxidoreductase [Dehalococcoidia bacterium]|nr:SDR family NAD(P)-dependent oxidoreductase [Dehalococcoidia bacterium]
MRIPSLSLAGQTALVTGGRRGIGKDTALVLAEAGADVAVCDLVTETGELSGVAEEIKQLGRHSLACQVDVKNRQSVAEMMKKVVDTFGKIDILVNNAGIGSPEGPTDPERWAEREKQMMERMALRMDKPMVSLFNEEGWDAVLSTNLRSVILCSQAVCDTMIKNGRGAIVNVASVMAYSRGGSAFSPYSISKRGIVMVTEGLAVDLARYNIRVNAIAPGAIETEMMRYVWHYPERLKMLESRVLLGGKLLKPLDCAHLILFLVSDLAKYITGQTVVVDGGLTLAPGGMTG